MPIPTYRPRSASFFLAPYAGAPAPAPMGYTRRHGGVWPGTPAYPTPDAAGPLSVCIRHDAGAASSSSSSPDAIVPETAAGKFVRDMRPPVTAAAALGAALPAAALGHSLGGARHGVAGAVVGGVAGLLVGGGIGWWLSTKLASETDQAAPQPDKPSNGSTDAGAQSYLVTRSAEFTSSPQPTYAPITPIDATPPPPTAPPAKPNGVTTSSVDAKPASDEKPLPWGWIVGGGLALVVVIGGVAYAASSSPRRRRRSRGR